MDEFINFILDFGYGLIVGFVVTWAAWKVAVSRWDMHFRKLRGYPVLWDAVRKRK